MVAWPTDGSSDTQGQFNLSDAGSERDCRWDDSSREMKDPKGNLITVNASLVLDQTLPVGSVVYRGSLDSLALLEGLPSTVVVKPWSGLATLFEVVALDETFDLRNRVCQRTVGLNRYSDDMQGPPDSEPPVGVTLLAWFRNGGTDRSGNGRDLTATGNPAVVSGVNGVTGAAVRLVPGQDYFTSITTGQIVPTSGAFSIVLFARVVSGAPSALHQDNLSDVFGLTLDAANNLVEMYVRTGVGIEVTSSVDQYFHHYAATWDGYVLKLYRDGEVIGASSSVPDPSIGVFALGRDGSGAVDVQNVGIYTGALTQAGVRGFYNEGMGFDPTL